MNEATDYVHTHVINYEPTYFVLDDCAQAWAASRAELPELRDQLRDAVEKHRDAMGLDADDLSDDVDYSAMIRYEADV